MDDRFIRTKMLIGDEAVNKLKKSRVIVFGVGGVGGFVCEALARCAVENIDLVDYDTVSISNINRQIIALSSTIGQYKTDVMANRILDINPQANVKSIKKMFLPENADCFDLSVYDYVIDAVDNVSAKIELAQRCEKLNIPIISSMGTGNKTDPSKFIITDIYKTEKCPLARVMRHELRKRGVKKLKVLYSKADIEKTYYKNSDGEKTVPASISFVPSVAGLMIAGEVINDILKKENE